MKLLASLVVAFVMAGCQSLPLSNPPPASQTFSLDGATLSYVQQGAGAPVVFVHGGFSDHRIWEPQRQVVADKYRYVALSMRYFGTTPWPDDGANFSQATHVADLAAFIRALDAGPVYLVGRSYGAATALALAVRHPELVRALLLNEPPIPSAVTDPSAQKAVAEDRKGLAAVAGAAKAGSHAEAVKQFYEWVNDLPGGFELLPPAAQAMLLDNARTVPLQINPKTPLPMSCAELGAVKVPVTITKGELTRPYFALTAEAVHRCMPGSRLITIAGARHGAPSQKSGAFNEVLLSFLSAE